jgi:DNA-binding FrmR family transcriptional regulator
MVDEDRYCIDVLTQSGAIQAALDKVALDKVALGLLDGHARHCLLGEGTGPESAAEQADELMGAVGKLMRRG